MSTEQKDSRPVEPLDTVASTPASNTAAEVRLKPDTTDGQRPAYKKPSITRHGNLRLMTQLD